MNKPLQRSRLREIRCLLEAKGSSWKKSRPPHSAAAPAARKEGRLPCWRKNGSSLDEESGSEPYLEGQQWGEGGCWAAGTLRLEGPAAQRWTH